MLGGAGAEEVRAKQKPLEEFTSRSLTPGGAFVELGDSMPRRPQFVRGGSLEFALSNGVTGTEIPRIKMYNAGYVFGCSGLVIAEQMNWSPFILCALDRLVTFMVALTTYR
ncbi:Uncharacterised protein [Corynebacterium minutissimum]|uniref:Uncharacterized protein n=2 Tax=Corynebacterium minutissimum TaxID=38301 RepID=A0A376D3I6_9CORY|nr:Uncharacterised protein [Corynebacterium minutissimum]